MAQDRDVLITGQIIVPRPEEQRLSIRYLTLRHSREREGVGAVSALGCGKGEGREQLSELAKRCL